MEFSIEKHNPNHGADGRFTSGPGTGGGSRFTTGAGKHAGTSAKAREVAARIGPSKYRYGDDLPVKEWTSNSGNMRTFTTHATYTDPNGVEYDLEYFERHDSYREGEWKRANLGVKVDGDTASVRAWPNDDETAWVIWGADTAQGHRRKGLATAALEMMRRHSDLPVAHSGSLLPDGKKFAEVVKYNQNHGPDGRFSSGAGGATVIRVKPSGGSPSDFADTRMAHQAPTNDGYNAPIFAADRIYPADVYGPKAARFYGSGFPELDKQALSTLNAVKGDPTATVTVYRTINALDNGALPEAVLRPGDWVTPTLSYAQEHADDDRAYIIVSAEVPAGHLFTDANSLQEWGYDPSGEVQKYNENHDERGRFSTSDGGTASWDNLRVGSNNETGSLFARKALTAISTVHGIKNLPAVQVDHHSKESALEVSSGAEGWYVPDSSTVNVSALAANPTYTVVHEFGHLMDREVLGSTGKPASLRLPGVYADADYSGVRAALAASPTMGRIANQGGFIGKYLAKDAETFARAYSQWIVLRSGDASLRRQLEDERKNLPNEVWPDDEFEPIAAAMDGLFAAKGLLDGSIEKYNENHDDRGRFSSGSGGGGVVIGDADPALKARVNKAASMIEAATGVKLNGIHVEADAAKGVHGVYFPERQTIGLSTKARAEVSRGTFVLAEEGTAIHELSHHLDYQMGPGKLVPLSDTPAAKDFLTAAKTTDSGIGKMLRDVKVGRGFTSKTTAKYVSSSHEVFARAMVQYIDLKNDGFLGRQPSFGESEERWDDAEFAEKIMPKLDALFGSPGAANATLSKSEGQTA